MQRVTQADKNKGIFFLPSLSYPKHLEKLKAQKDLQLMKKESQLTKLNDEEVLIDLKAKGLPTFGTKQEKLDRLKKFYGKYRDNFSFFL